MKKTCLSKHDVLFLRKNVLRYEQKLSQICKVKKVYRRHLTTKWESNHQTGVGAQPDQNLPWSKLN